MYGFQFTPPYLRTRLLFEEEKNHYTHMSVQSCPTSSIFFLYFIFVHVSKMQKTRGTAVWAAQRGEGEYYCDRGSGADSNR